MEELKKAIEKLSSEELERANKKFKMFASAHEGYSVIKEEIEEAAQELEDAKANLEHLWKNTKMNKVGTAMYNAENLKDYAINLAAEAVQVVAMAQKFIDSSEINGQ